MIKTFEKLRKSCVKLQNQTGIKSYENLNLKCISDEAYCDHEIKSELNKDHEENTNWFQRLLWKLKHVFKNDEEFSYELLNEYHCFYNAARFNVLELILTAPHERTRLTQETNPQLWSLYQPYFHKDQAFIKDGMVITFINGGHPYLVNSTQYRSEHDIITKKANKVYKIALKLQKRILEHAVSRNSLVFCPPMCAIVKYATLSFFVETIVSYEDIYDFQKEMNNSNIAQHKNMFIQEIKALLYNCGFSQESTVFSWIKNMNSDFGKLLGDDTALASSTIYYLSRYNLIKLPRFSNLLPPLFVIPILNAPIFRDLLFRMRPEQVEMITNFPNYKHVIKTEIYNYSETHKHKPIIPLSDSAAIIRNTQFDIKTVKKDQKPLYWYQKLAFSYLDYITYKATGNEFVKKISDDTVEPNIPITNPGIKKQLDYIVAGVRVGTLDSLYYTSPNYLALKSIQQNLVPKLASDLYNAQVVWVDSSDISKTLHKYGIPVKFIPMILQLKVPDEVQQLLHADMFARSFKHWFTKICRPNLYETLFPKQSSDAYNSSSLLNLQNEILKVVNDLMSYSGSIFSDIEQICLSYWDITSYGNCTRIPQFAFDKVDKYIMINAIKHHLNISLQLIKDRITLTNFQTEDNYYRDFLKETLSKEELECNMTLVLDESQNTINNSSSRSANILEFTQYYHSFPHIKVLLRYIARQDLWNKPTLAKFFHGFFPYTEICSPIEVYAKKPLKNIRNYCLNNIFTYNQTRYNLMDLALGPLITKSKPLLHAKNIEKEIDEEKENLEENNNGYISDNNSSNVSNIQKELKCDEYKKEYIFEEKDLSFIDVYNALQNPIFFGSISRLLGHVCEKFTPCNPICINQNCYYCHNINTCVNYSNLVENLSILFNLLLSIYRSDFILYENIPCMLATIHCHHFRYEEAKAIALYTLISFVTQESPESMRLLCLLIDVNTLTGDFDVSIKLASVISHKNLSKYFIFVTPFYKQAIYSSFVLNNIFNNRSNNGYSASNLIELCNSNKYTTWLMNLFTFAKCIENFNSKSFDAFCLNFIDTIKTQPQNYLNFLLMAKTCYLLSINQERCENLSDVIKSTSAAVFYLQKLKIYYNQLYISCLYNLSIAYYIKSLTRYVEYNCNIIKQIKEDNIYSNILSPIMNIEANISTRPNNTYYLYSIDCSPFIMNQLSIEDIGFAIKLMDTAFQRQIMLLRHISFEDIYINDSNKIVILNPNVKEKYCSSHFHQKWKNRLKQIRIIVSKFIQMKLSVIDYDLVCKMSQQFIDHVNQQEHLAEKVNIFSDTISDKENVIKYAGWLQLKTLMFSEYKKTDLLCDKVLQECCEITEKTSLITKHTLYFPIALIKSLTEWFDELILSSVTETTKRLREAELIIDMYRAFGSSYDKNQFLWNISKTLNLEESNIELS